MKSFLQIEGLSKSFGDRVLFSDVTFGVYEGDKIGLIAKNGMGKTTFRNDLRVAYLRQLPVFPEGISVIDACTISNDSPTNAIRNYEKALNTGDNDALSHAMAQMEACGAWDYEAGVLTQTYDAKSIRSEMIEQPEGFPKMFANMIAKKSVSELKKHAKRPQRSTVLTLTSDTLMLKDTMEKNPETDSYMRVKTEL